jgi:hypothetical protein
LELLVTATAIAFPNIAFIKERLARLGRTNGAGGLGAGNITGGTALYRENQDKLQRLERELSPNLLYDGITHTRDDVLQAVEMFASMEGVQVIHFTHYGH